MVRKEAKFGVHSGNSLKASLSEYNRRYSNEAFIVKHCYHDAGVHMTDAFEELKSDGTVYSLNKKGRWLLPSILREHILFDDHSGEQNKVAMLEHHKIKRQANCTSYCASKGRVCQVSNRKTYFNEKSVLEQSVANARHAGRRNRRRRGHINTEDVDLTPPTPEIRYDVFYPSPVTSSIYHNPKYILNDCDRQLTNIDKSKKSRNKVNQVRYHDTKVFGTDRAPWINEFDEDYDFFDEDDEEFLEINRNSTTTLDEVVEKAINAQKITHVKARSSSEVKGHRYGKGDAKYIGNDEDSTEGEEKPVQDSETSLVPPAVSFHAVRIIVPTETVSAPELSRCYDNTYFEAECSPRKFVLNISDQATEQFRKLRSVRNVHVLSYLVFTYDGCYDDDHNVYRVYLNSNIKGDLQILTLFDLQHATVTDIIEQSLNFMKIILYEMFPESTRDGAKERPKRPFDLLQSVCRQESESCLLRDLSLAKLQNLQSGREAVSMSDSWVVVDSDEPADVGTYDAEFCNICCEGIESSVESSKPATALQKCRHWFCDDCWQSHLRSSMLRPIGRILCPEYECDNVVDLVTMVTLMPVRDLHVVVEHQCEREIQASEIKPKWCPNPACGRLIKVNREDSTNGTLPIICDCGQDLCFQCLNPSHWPASCEQVDLYHKKLKQFNDDKMVPIVDRKIDEIVVCAKRCPTCRVWVDKNGGCPYMSCICGEYFCWKCCIKIKDHPSPSVCQTNDDKMKSDQFMFHGNSDYAIRTVNRSKCYLMARGHRLARHQINVTHLRRACHVLTRKILKNFPKILPMMSNEMKDFLSIEVTDDVTTGKQKIQAFLLSMLKFDLELNHVIEHTAVWMDGKPDKMICRQIRHLMQRLGFFSYRNNEILMNDAQDLKAVLPKLMNLKTWSKTTLNRLVCLLSTPEAKECMES